MDEIAVTLLACDRTLIEREMVRCSLTALGSWRCGVHMNRLIRRSNVALSCNPMLVSLM